MTKRKRRSDLAVRRPLRSPGRPPVWRRDHLTRFWSLVASGRSSEDAAVAAGVSPVVGTRWFREAGGMPPSHLAPSAKPPSGRYLSFAEREEIALLRVRGHGVREIARRLGRAPSTLSRELRRNAATRGGGQEYRAMTARGDQGRGGARVGGRRPRRAGVAAVDPPRRCRPHPDLLRGPGGAAARLRAERP